MKAPKQMNWGILGCGKIAHKFAEDLQTVPNANLYAVASRQIEKAKKFSQQHHASNYYGSYEELALDKEIDVIYVATPHMFHFEHTIMCLNNKKAVLCEKPFAMNHRQVEKMIETAQKNNVFLMEALWTYFLPHYRHVLEIIESKAYGEIKNLKADFGFSAKFDPNGRLFNKELGGGSLLDVGIYPLFAALTLLGYPKEITAKAKIGKTGVDESCTIDLQYEGATASLFSAITKKTKTQAVVELEKATVIINSRFHEPSSITITANEYSELLEFKTTTFGYNFEAIHVQEMLYQQRTESTVMSFNKSLQLVKLLDAVRSKINLSYNL
ncbi:Gfo/Idh/MocA family oxidoreductase [Aquimarina sp. D1M17]|uniref:Gfo/Idh/MocA family protein n=1 Tax=Aquimarina acroporae TaxID=2937283 RepID=UPI0020BE1AD3|nr:Gfo/Idh/MocA family oxidoreductase [Aquimarina acroporae]MCK8520607.1 Gfo/Idh/MocA family oxidoreductase [Aquimarina acroporae]